MLLPYREELCIEKTIYNPNVIFDKTYSSAFVNARRLSRIRTKFLNFVQYMAKIQINNTIYYSKDGHLLHNTSHLSNTYFAQCEK